LPIQLGKASCQPVLPLPGTILSSAGLHRRHSFSCWCKKGPLLAAAPLQALHLSSTFVLRTHCRQGPSSPLVGVSNWYAWSKQLACLGSKPLACLLCAEHFECLNCKHIFNTQVLQPARTLLAGLWKHACRRTCCSGPKPRSKHTEHHTDRQTHRQNQTPTEQTGAAVALQSRAPGRPPGRLAPPPRQPARARGA